MYTAQHVLRRVVFQAIGVTLVWFAMAALGGVAHGQTTATSTTAIVGAVGGVSIDTDGVLRNARADQLGMLSKLRLESLEKIPAELDPAAPLRKISLRRLEAALESCARNNRPIPDAIKYLAGLQHICYVFVYPEQKDIVLVGPGEGWKVDAKGNVVGVATGRPVMLLDDLLLALRTANAARNGGITCSIDPTPEGLARMTQQLPGLTRSGDPQTVAGGIETALGMQRISVRGVPETSHFARVLVAADYRMKRIAMNFEPSPVRGLPSYLQMVKPSARTVLSPRFWLEPTYEALLRDDDGMAFELRGSGVKAMTEEDFIAQSGNVQHSGKAGPAAQKWADLMTDKYPALAVADPIFGQLQNCMELAIVGALVVKEQLAEKAGYSMSTLLESPAVKPDVLSAPKQVESKASVLKKGKSWVISASGGVAINSWALADKPKPSDAVAPVRAKAAAAEGGTWYWN
jgi:hypothetical protein